jgi:hypothetical protein
MADRGSVLPAVLALAFGGLLILGVSMDLGRWASSHREAASAADAGAQAGAAMVLPNELRLGVVAVDGDAARVVAEEAALGSRPRAGRVVQVIVVDNEVCVAIEQTYTSRLLSSLGVTPDLVRATSCASPARG